MPRTITAAVAALLTLSASPALAAEFVIKDGRTSPENLTINPAGDVITGSFSTPLINILKKGSTTAETFIDLTNDGGGTTLGVLADAGSNTLWACQLTSGEGGRQSHLRGFDLLTGAAKLRWTLPSPSTCNDMAVAPDRALFVADFSGKIYRLPSGSQTAELFLDGPLVAAADGIAFLNGQLYYNSFMSGKLYRAPIDSAGKSSAPPIEITLDTPLSRPDGMRPSNGKLFVAEQGNGRISSITLIGDTGKVAVVKDGLQRPSGVQPAGDTLWFNEFTLGKVWSVPIPG